MAQNPLTMEVIKQDGISIRETARRLGISRNSVKKYLALAGEDLPGDEALAGQVYNNDSLAHDEQRMADLNVHFNRHSAELSRTGVTRQLLWQEYPYLQFYTLHRSPSPQSYPPLEQLLGNRQDQGKLRQRHQNHPP